MKDQLLREAPLNLKPKVKIGLCVSDGWSLDEIRWSKIPTWVFLDVRRKPGSTGYEPKHVHLEPEAKTPKFPC